MDKALILPEFIVEYDYKMQEEWQKNAILLNDI